MRMTLRFFVSVILLNFLVGVSKGKSQATGDDASGTISTDIVGSGNGNTTGAGTEYLSGNISTPYIPQISFQDALSIDLLMGTYIRGLEFGDGVIFFAEEGKGEDGGGSSDVAKGENLSAGTSSILGSRDIPFGYEQLGGFKEYSSLEWSTALATSDYMLGPGDSIAITVYGKGAVPSISKEEKFQSAGAAGVLLSNVFPISPEGKIFVPPIGEVIARGMRVAELQELLSKELGTYYRDMKVSVFLVGLRRIQIFVLGQVNSPGIYMVRSLTRVSQAIALARGPTPLASIRHVQIVRGGKVVATVDMYKFLLKGDKEENPFLEPGDTVILPSTNRTVRILGEVRRPGIYELTSGEKLSDLIVMAGGVTPKATLEELKIENQSKPDEIITVNAYSLLIEHKNNVDRELRTGDIVIVPSVPTTVTLVGQVIRGGTFRYEPGAPFSYYLGLAGGFSERANTKKVLLTRRDGTVIKSDRNTVIKPGDTIVVGASEIKGWRDVLNLAVQSATLFFIIYQMAK